VIGRRRYPVALPSKQDLIKRSWEYCPCPRLCDLEDPPPIPKETFFHLFSSKLPHKSPFWLNRFAKKLKTSIHPDCHPSRSSSVVTGYGILIIESLNTKVLLAMGVILVLFSCIFTVIWAAITKDAQTATGIGSLLIASFGTLLVMFQQLYPKVMDIT
jgi:hypothetical protein